MLNALRELGSYRRLVKQLAVRDLKARYKVSILGFFWSLLRPLLTIVVLAVIFSYLLSIHSEVYSVPYYILLLAAYMPWFYFSTALLEGTQSLLINGNLIKKVYSPRLVYPASVVLAQLVNFLFSLMVVIPFLFLFSGAYPTWAFLQLPLFIAAQTAFLFGLCLIASVLNVLYRDTTQVMEFTVFVWFYLSPVLYDSSQVFSKLVESASTSSHASFYFFLYFLNPMAGILEGYRYALLASNMQPVESLSPLLQGQNQVIFYAGIPYSLLSSVVVLILGFWLHKRMETRAVDAL